MIVHVRWPSPRDCANAEPKSKSTVCVLFIASLCSSASDGVLNLASSDIGWRGTGRALKTCWCVRSMRTGMNSRHSCRSRRYEGRNAVGGND